MDIFIIKIMIAMLNWNNDPEVIQQSNDINELCTVAYNDEVQIAHKIDALKKHDSKSAVKLEDDVLNVAIRIHHDVMQEIVKRQIEKGEVK
jgi:hypothetical protein